MRFAIDDHLHGSSRAPHDRLNAFSLLLNSNPKKILLKNPFDLKFFLFGKSRSPTLIISSSAAGLTEQKAATWPRIDPFAPK